MKKMKKQYIYSLIGLFIFGNIFAQQTPASKQSADYSIEGATAHLGNGKVIENSLIMFSMGKIQFVGSNNAKINRLGIIIKADGKHVYPGFIIANSTLGLGEIEAVKASIDDDEVGSMLPHIRSLIAYNAESKIVETMRPNGILIGQIIPRGGVISGTSSVVQFDAWNWEDAAVNVDEGIHLIWPKSFISGGRRFSGPSGPNKKYASSVKEITIFLNEAKAYLKGSGIPKNLPFDAVKGLFEGSKKLYVHANSVIEITDVIAFCNELGIPKLVLVNGNDAYKIAPLLIENDIPVIVEKAHRRPSREDDDYDLPYRTASMLVKKGITVAIGMEDRMNARNLPFYAGTYAAYGLGKEEALKLITSNTAKILGIDDIMGTLEVGKSATLFISEGDALDIRTNKLTHAFIDGRKISLETHQTKLWKRYSKKYSSH